MAVLPISVPSIRPRQDNTLNSLLKIGDAFTTHYQTQQSNKLIEQAAGGDENALIKLYGSNPHAAKGIYGMQQDKQKTQKSSFLADAVGALSLIAESDDPATAWSQYAPMIKQKYPDQAADIPDQYDEAYMRKAFLELAGMEGNLGKVGQSLGSKYGYLPTDADALPADVQSFQYRQGLPPEQQAQFDQFKTKPATSRPVVREVPVAGGMVQLHAIDPATQQMSPIGEPYAAEAAGSQAPASLQEIAWLEKATPEQRELYWENKRAPQALNLGGTQRLVAPGGQERSYDVTQKQAPAALGVTPNAPPEMQAQQAAQAEAMQAEATERAKQQQQLEFAGPKQTATDQAALGVKKEANLPKAQASLQTVMASSDRVANEIQDAIKMVNNFTAGPAAGLSAIPGTPARDLKAKIATIKANIGFDALQEMRANSPTGGALGQVAVQEIEYLQAVLGNLDQAQSTGQLKEALGQVAQQIQSRKQRYQSAFMQDFGQGSQGPPQAPTQPPQGATGGKTVTMDQIQRLSGKAGISLEEARQKLLDAGYMIR